MIILCIFNINYILLKIFGSHSNIISDSYVFHYGNELVFRTGNKGIRHFVTTNYNQSTHLHRHHAALSILPNETANSYYETKLESVS